MSVNPSISPVSGGGSSAANTVLDWSDKSSMAIPMPKMATLNFTSITAMPTTKTDDLHGVLEFTDNNGNSFTKKAIVNAQGNSSLAWAKKNIAIDLCNDEWIGDDTFAIKFGEWVWQDSFHLKANFVDFFKVVPMVGYDVFKDMQDASSYINARSWRQANLEVYGVHQFTEKSTKKDMSLRIDTGALCHPMGFPCIVNLNGEFYGIYNFMLKKHRDNYMMNKKTATHVHIDSDKNVNFFVSQDTEFWTNTDIRNPKNLYAIDGTEFDGDDPKELAGTTEVTSWINSGYLPDGTKVTSKIQGYLETTAEVKGYISDVVDNFATLASATTTEAKKAAFDAMFDANNIIDYMLFSNYTSNLDGYYKNCQWTTWDGVKWYANPYDLDLLWGTIYHGQAPYVVEQSELPTHTNSNLPFKYCKELYSNEIAARYAELRDCGVFDAKRVIAKVTDYMSRIGLDAYEAEYDKWTPSCNQAITWNTGWQLATDPDTGKPYESDAYRPSFSGVTEYVSGTTYSAGDKVIIHHSEASAIWLVAEATTTVSTTPVKTWAFYDSIERLAYYIETRQDYLDDLYDYS